MSRAPIGCLLALLLTSCSAFNAYVNRDATENEVQLHDKDSSSLSKQKRGPHNYSVIAFTANRRAVTVTNNSMVENANGRLIFCAEPPPDAISALMASDSANFGLTSGSSEELKTHVASTYATAAKGIAARNPMVEVYRTAVYTICQLYADGVLDKTAAAKAFNETTKNVVAKMDGNTPAVDPGVPIGAWTFESNADGTTKVTAQPVAAPAPAKKAEPEAMPDCKEGEKEHPAGFDQNGKVAKDDKGCRKPAPLPYCADGVKPHAAGTNEKGEKDASDLGCAKKPAA